MNHPVLTCNKSSHARAKEYPSLKDEYPSRPCRSSRVVVAVTVRYLTPVRADQSHASLMPIARTLVVHELATGVDLLGDAVSMTRLHALVKGRICMTTITLVTCNPGPKISHANRASFDASGIHAFCGMARTYVRILLTHNWLFLPSKPES